MGNLNNQKGIVLVAAMLMILMVSGIAVSVMSGSTLDSKMVNATQESYQAESLTRGDTEKVIKDEISNRADSKFLQVRKKDDSNIETTLLDSGSKVIMTYENKNKNEPLLECPPSFAPTPNIRCNYLKLTSTKQYGRTKKHTMTMNTGLTQEMGGGISR